MVHVCTIKKAGGCWVAETISAGDARATFSHDRGGLRVLRPHVTAVRFLFTRCVKHAGRADGLCLRGGGTAAPVRRRIRNAQKYD